MSGKVATCPKISLVQNNEITSDESKVANSFSNFFENAIQTLGIKSKKYSNDNHGLKVQLKLLLRNMSSISVSFLLRGKNTNNESFHFLPTELERILEEIINLDN